MRGLGNHESVKFVLLVRLGKQSPSILLHSLISNYNGKELYEAIKIAGIPQLTSSRYGGGQSLIKLQTLSCVTVVLAASLHMKRLETAIICLTKRKDKNKCRTKKTKFLYETCKKVLDLVTF